MSELFTIRMVLARTPDNPEGNAHVGYEFTAPLNAESMLDAIAWRDFKKDCTVVRFTDKGDDRHGHLVHVGQGWRFHYVDEDPDGDRPIFKLDRHRLVEGEYLTVIENEDQLRTYHIVQVRPSPRDGLD